MAAATPSRPTVDQLRRLRALPGLDNRDGSGVLPAVAGHVSACLEVGTALVLRDGREYRLLHAAGRPDDVPGAEVSLPDVGDADARVRVSGAGAEARTVFELAVSESGRRILLVLDGDWGAVSASLEDALRALAGPVQAADPRGPMGLAVHHLVEDLAALRDGAGVGRVLVTHVARAVGARVVTLALPTGAAGLRVVATHGYPISALPSTRLVTPGHGVLTDAYARALPVLARDVRSSMPSDDGRAVRSHTVFAVPILQADEVLGVIAATDRIDGRAFTYDDVNLVCALAAPASLALGRARADRRAEAHARAAVTDPGSGLFNRLYFQTRLEEELKRSARLGTPLSLLLLDIDAFKSVNDTYGHLAGDTVIRDIAGILKRSVRGFDVCARYGGEEFAVAMPGSRLDVAAAIAERIRQRIEAYRPTDPGIPLLAVTASIGVSQTRPDVTLRQAFEEVDRALYAAKRSGRNRVRAAAAD